MLRTEKATGVQQSAFGTDTGLLTQQSEDTLNTHSIIKQHQRHCMIDLIKVRPFWLTDVCACVFCVVFAKRRVCSRGRLSIAILVSKGGCERRSTRCQTIGTCPRFGRGGGDSESVSTHVFDTKLNLEKKTGPFCKTLKKPKINNMQNHRHVPMVLRRRRHQQNR